VTSRVRAASVLGAATALVWAATPVLLPPASGGDGAPGSVAARAPATVVLDGVRVRLRAGTEQVVTVNHTRGYRARVTFWRLTDSGWTRRFASTDGRIGYGGLVPGKQRRQGSGTTPLGTYRLPWAFGFQERRDSWRLRYRSVERGDFWVQDNASRYYNRYRNRAQGGFRWWLPAGDPNSSERLTDFRRQYDLSIVIAYNQNQVRHRGAGIFLHMNGRGATAGCVSAPRRFIQKAMGALDPDLAPVIAVGR
jgi:L,D-peptidoglycan transpeptidase YkuD (ErfK/YbiS/YcfS/YnhG family)